MVMVKNQSMISRLFDVCNYALLALLSLVTFLPFIYVIISSFSATTAVFPTHFTLDAYKYIFSTPTVGRSLLNSILITTLGSLFNLLLTSLMAYPLAKKDLLGRKLLLFMVTFTMLFGGGMIPTYFVVKALGLIDSYAALILPVAISAFNLIVMKNFFQSIPEELEEAARIDGCHDVGILFRIALPLSAPALAAFGLFYAVEHWNNYFSAVLYLNDGAKWPVQVILRQIVILATDSSLSGDPSALDGMTVIEQSVKMAVIVVATVPILLVYPFLQKHFTKGVMLGSVKG
jgi:putative aldouronate transport system permease protein